MASKPIIIEGNSEATHYANLYREAHVNADVMGRRYSRMLTGVEALMSTIPREQQDGSTYVLLSAIVAASRWDGENR